MPIKRTGALFIVQRISFITFCGGMLLIESLRLKGFSVLGIKRVRDCSIYNSLIHNTLKLYNPYTCVYVREFAYICTEFER